MLKWFGLWNSKIKHATHDYKNSICGLIRSPQNDKDTIKIDRGSELATCIMCTLALPQIFEQQIKDTKDNDLPRNNRKIPTG